MRRIFWVAFVGFFLLGGAWACALPVNGTYDESQHVVRAYAAVDGQWPPHGPTAQSFDVPATLLPENPECMRDGDDPRPATCLTPRPERGDVSTTTYVARYNPAYYLAVGLPLKLWPDLTGIVLARLLSALLCALMLAASVWLAMTAGNRFLAAAVVLVATPMVVNLAGSVNPNGMEIAAAILLFTSLICLVTGQRVPRRAALACAGVAAFALITVRHIGPVLVVTDLAAVAVLAGLARVRAEVRRRDAWAWLGGGVVAGFVVFGGWVLAARSPVGAGPGDPSDLGVGGILKGLVTHRFEFYVEQIVGQFGYGETTISPLAVLWWYALVAVVVVPGFVVATWRARLVMAGLLVAGLGMLVALEFHFVPTAGWFSHGRYALPILVGTVLIAGLSLGSVSAGPVPRIVARLPRWVPVWLSVVVVALTAPVHVYALVRVVSRYRVGIDASFSPFSGAWSPPVHPAVSMLAVLVGVVFLALCARPRPMIAESDQRGTRAQPSTRTVSAD